MNSVSAAAARILEFMQSEALPIGSHLPAQMLADRLRVSRSPVNQALSLLYKKGLLRRERNRGYFVAKAIDQALCEEVQTFGLQQPDAVTRAYFRIAEDRLQGHLPDEFAEQWLKARYALTSAQLNAVLGRIAQEGWAERKPGYGWAFSAMLTTPDSLLQSYRLRLALEPAALLEPGFRLAPQVLERCRAAEHQLLDGGIAHATPDQLHARGVRFHEALVEASGNAFFIDAIKRVNRVRRLLSYRSMQDRERYAEHCRQHLQILELLAQGRQQDAAHALRAHLAHTLEALAQIADLLEPSAHAAQDSGAPRGAKSRKIES